MRLWRGTDLSTLASGATKTLSPHTIGYESDEDVDNGFRPAGPVIIDGILVEQDDTVLI